MQKKVRNLFRQQPYIPFKGSGGTSVDETLMSRNTLFSQQRFLQQQMREFRPGDH
jgi:hypothetical protein